MGNPRRGKATDPGPARVYLDRRLVSLLLRIGVVGVSSIVSIEAGGSAGTVSTMRPTRVEPELDPDVVVAGLDVEVEVVGGGLGLF